MKALSHSELTRFFKPSKILALGFNCLMDKAIVDDSSEP